MMVLKRREIMAAALVVLIGVAGYLNWSYQDTIRVTDGESYIETGKKLGEAQYVNASADEPETTQAPQNIENKADTEEDYFTKSRLEKESSRSRALEILNQTAGNESFSEDVRQEAQKQILAVADNVEKETAVENMARAKGYSRISVYISDNTANIAVKKEGLSETDIAKIQDIVMSQVKISAENIKIIEVK